MLATGSEVALAVQAAQALSSYRVRVVSMPCLERFEAQSIDYQEQVLPRVCRYRVAIEAAASQPWYRYVGLEGRVVALDRFGASAPEAALFKEYGFTVEHIVSVVRGDLSGKQEISE